MNPFIPSAQRNPFSFLFRMHWTHDVLFILILLIGIYFRTIGLNWDDNTHLHPDERFLTMVLTNIAPVDSLTEYFDTEKSTLNPHNRGFTFYVYGTFPIFVVRYLAESLDQKSYHQIHLLGRQLSALMDLFTILLVYLIGIHLYERKVGLLAATFSALAVLQIQLSHYFTVDTFANFFTLLAFYFVVKIAVNRSEIECLEGFNKNTDLLRSLGFAISLGLAVASKLSVAPFILLLPGAIIIRLIQSSSEGKRYSRKMALFSLALALLTLFLVFRLCQPYAFSGSGFFDLRPNPKWLQNLSELLAQTSGHADYPPALQWARRPVWFSWQNMVQWGMGWPLGLLAWGGFIWMGSSILRREWRNHILLWSYTAIYFIWQSLVFNPTMRYQLPIYSTLVIIAAWALVRLWEDNARSAKRILVLSLGGFVLLSTLAWAFAFTRIYTRPVTRVAATRWIYQNLPGPLTLHIQTSNEQIHQPLPYRYDALIQPGQPYNTTFTSTVNGVLNEIFLAHVVDKQAIPGMKTLLLRIIDPDKNIVLATATSTAEFLPKSDYRGQGYLLQLNQPLSLRALQKYSITLELQKGYGAIALYGSAPANESSWDDGLPLPIEGYDGFGGIYQGGLNLEIYWDDNAEKQKRFYAILDQADYIFITSNRQWGTTVRLPERYPLTTAYYRHLLGCPPEKDVPQCYRVAEVGTFQGNLGFDLVAVFQSNPSLGLWQINDQFAEEAFTVYDHPKVMIFKKQADYDPDRVRNILGAVNLSKVIHITPGEANFYPKDLMLSSQRLSTQQSGGTWAELFNPQAFHNRWPIIGALLWYVSITFLGLLIYPFVRLALPGLPDRGYPLSRITGLLLLSYFIWLAGSMEIPFTRLTISLTLALFTLCSVIISYYHRFDLRQEWHHRYRYFLIVEALALTLFAFCLLIRIGNPDLWHPSRGGEKPMDFSYFNAVLKSTTFPPYDPWFAGGYINYYYYGFVLVGVLVKWLGIVPAIAYNLILPLLLSVSAIGAFSVAWNLTQAQCQESSFRPNPYLTGFAAAFGLAVLGNLETVQMVCRSLFKSLVGKPIAYSLGEWYWNSSRVIPAPNEVGPITESPFFTFLYGDLHAHFMALPLTLLVLSWGLSMVFGHKWGGKKTFRSFLQLFSFILFGGLIIGALRLTNTWDFPTYLILGMLAVGHTVWYNLFPTQNSLPPHQTSGPRFWMALILMAILVILALLLYQPFTRWYGQAYGTVTLWKGTRTPLWSYLTHWGLFLFVILTWIIWETRDWLASTPVSALSKLRPYHELIKMGSVLFLSCLGGLIFWGVQIAWLVLPLLAWTGILVFRSGLLKTKRIVLLLTWTGLMITLLVEIIVLQGDICRVNTVFKFYFQVWTLFAIGAAMALGWLLPIIPIWLKNWHRGWQVGLILLVGASSLFPLIGGVGKMRDRMAPQAPRTLDGMAYMQYATHSDQNTILYFEQDYRAIRWMQDHIPGSPVIVEANTPEYRWGSRYTIYTGLPGVVGWNWHQRQQRALVPPEWITNRIAEIDEFYRTTDLSQAKAFLRKYHVQYIIIGQLERAYYSSPGLEKFPMANGSHWQEVYRDRETAIYQVRP